uniref:ZP domain-containing protein n=1 Tax=Gasterosteus aculeatus aculeatus TaxID=481459 RepID=A0AAQ4QIS9_GASAC
MASTSVLLLQLLLVSQASASHFFGGTTTYYYKGKNPDGTFKVDLRYRDTFDGCYYSLYWSCSQGNCGNVQRRVRGEIESSTNAPLFNRQWCETETVSRTILQSNKPFQLTAASCCWIPKRTGDDAQWNLLTTVDLGIRSDTKEPNRSPAVAILPFLRVPQNCPRTYKLMSFDPDGDKVRCRYGNINTGECSLCDQPSGFHLDQDTCTLHYHSSRADSRVYGFELVVEDFPVGSINLTYSDGSQSSRAPLLVRRRRSVFPPTSAVYNSWYNYQTTARPITYPWWYNPPPTTARTTTPPTTPYPWWYHLTPTARPITYPWWYNPPPTTARTTTPPTTTTYPWWHHHTTTAPPTTPPSTTTPYPWWYHHTPTARPITYPWWYNPPPTTARTTTPPTTTTYPWWHHHTTTAPRTTPPPTTTTPYPWWHHHTTTAPPTTPPPTTTTPYPWWHHHTTTAPRTTIPPYLTTRTHQHATTPPLSKLPLQFSFLVDPPVPSCAEGVYLPRFVEPTPENGAHIQAEVNREVEIRVKAVAAYSKIHDIIISGPVNITTQRNTDGDFVIRWTPIQDDLGDFFSICFAVESVAGSHGNTPHYYTTPSSQAGVYQTEMRCVVVEVKTKHVKSNVICTGTTMTIELEKASLPGHHADHLRLNDATNTACRLKSNNTHIFAVIPLNDCGTDIEEDDINLRFKNAITTFDNVADVITRKHLLEVDFYCQYPKRGNVTQVFTAHRPKVEVWDKGFGTFTYQFEFYPNNQYLTAIDPSTYPLVYVLGSRIFMQIEATSSINNTVLFVESCRATPYDNQNYQQTYSIIENGCNVDQTVEIHSTSHQRQFQFSMEAFKFIGSHDQVYISCTVLMCEAGSPNTRCSQGCVNSTMQSGWPAAHHHRKRELIAQGQRHFVSQGPLRLGRSAEDNKSPALQLNLNLVFIAGCLLAAVGMISAVALYKARGSRVRYQPLSTFES